MLPRMQMHHIVATRPDLLGHDMSGHDLAQVAEMDRPGRRHARHTHNGLHATAMRVPDHRGSRLLNTAQLRLSHEPLRETRYRASRQTSDKPANSRPAQAPGAVRHEARPCSAPAAGRPRLCPGQRGGTRHHITESLHARRERGRQGWPGEPGGFAVTGHAVPAAHGRPRKAARQAARHPHEAAFVAHRGARGRGPAEPGGQPRPGPAGRLGPRRGRRPAGRVPGRGLHDRAPRRPPRPARRRRPGPGRRHQ